MSKTDEVDLGTLKASAELSWMQRRGYLAKQMENFDQEMSVCQKTTVICVA
jgi:hypothetical protein